MLSFEPYLERIIAPSSPKYDRDASSMRRCAYEDIFKVVEASEA